MEASIAEHKDSSASLNCAPAQNAIYYAMTLFFVAAVCGGALFAPFHLDDSDGITDNPSVRIAGNFPRFWVDPKTASTNPDFAMYRPVAMTSYLVNYLICGYKPFGWHAASLAIHLMNVMLLMLLIKRFFKNYLTALWAGLIFGCHPGQVETIVYISARPGSLAAFFSLIAILTASAAAGTARRNLLFTISSGAAFLLALLSKETAASLPLLAAAFALCSGEKSSRRKWLFISGVWSVLLITYLIWRKWGIALATMPSREDRPLASTLMTQISVCAHYVREIFWPWGLSVVYGMKRVSGIFEPPSRGMLPPFAAIIFIAAVAAASISSMKKYPAIFLGAAWFFVSLIPESILPLNQIASDRRIYFPMIGLIFAAIEISKQLDRSKSRKAAAIIVVALFSILAASRVQIWKSNKSLWMDGVKKSPFTSATWLNLGKEYIDDREIGKGIKILWIAYQLDPENPFLMNNLGVALIHNNRVEDAVRIFELMTNRYPNYSVAWRNLGVAAANLKRYDEAERAFRKLVEIEPGDAKALMQLGNILYAKGDLGGAKNRYEASLRLNPEFDEARRNLDIVNAELNGK